MFLLRNSCKLSLPIVRFLLSGMLMFLLKFSKSSETRMKHRWLIDYVFNVHSANLISNLIVLHFK